MTVLADVASPAQGVILLTEDTGALSSEESENSSSNSSVSLLQLDQSNVQDLHRHKNDILVHLVHLVQHAILRRRVIIGESLKNSPQFSARGHSFILNQGIQLIVYHANVALNVQQTKVVNLSQVSPYLQAKIRQIIRCVPHELSPHFLITILLCSHSH